MAYESKKGKGKGKLRLFSILALLICGLAVNAEEIQSPVQEVDIKNSYLTKAHIKTNSKTEIQTIKVEKSFLVWITIQKAKDSTANIDSTK